MKIVLISKSYEAALGIGRSLFYYGYEDIDLVFIGKPHNANIALKSRVFKEKERIESRDDRAIVDFLMSKYSSEDKSVLFPADDYTTSLADRYRDPLESAFIYTYTDGHESGAITRLMDKAIQAQIAPEFDLPMAAYGIAEFKDNEFVVPDNTVFPCFVKPLVSANGAAKANMAKCADMNELKKHLAKVAAKGETEPMLVQEYIEIEEEFNIHGICDGDRLFLPVIHKKVAKGTFTKGVTVLGKNLNPEELEPYISKLKDMLLSFGFHGIFNVEMFRSNGKTYLNEINVRIAGTCWGTTGANANIPVLWVDTLLGKYKENWPELDVKYDTVFINDKTAYEEYILGYCSKAQFTEWNKRAQYHLIKNDDDRGPWKEFVKSMRKKQLKNILKKVKAIL